jgi:short-subunit dehydrogenase
MQLLILGANSTIAQAVARKFAEAEKANLYLASRDMEALRKSVRDIEIRYHVRAEALFFDATDFDSHMHFYENLDPKPNGVLLAFGYFADQQKVQQDFQQIRKILETNLVGAISILEVIAADFEKRGHGFIIGISSVAGERGRKGNYIYGSAKGALSIYLSGLRNRLFAGNIRVITVLPGFVRTKMTENLELPKKLTSESGEVAEDIYKSFRKNMDIIYTKWYWKWIMLLIKALPEKIFKRTNLYRH